MACAFAGWVTSGPCTRTSLPLPGGALDQQIAIGIEDHGNLKEGFARIFGGIDQRGQACDRRLVWPLQGCLQTVARGHGGELESAVFADGRNTHRQHGGIVVIDEPTKTRELVRE